MTLDELLELCCGLHPSARSARVEIIDENNGIYDADIESVTYESGVVTIRASGEERDEPMKPEDEVD